MLFLSNVTKYESSKHAVIWKKQACENEPPRFQKTTEDVNADITKTCWLTKKFKIRKFKKKISYNNVYKFYNNVIKLYHNFYAFFLKNSIRMIQKSIKEIFHLKTFCVSIIYFHYIFFFQYVFDDKLRNFSCFSSYLVLEVVITKSFKNFN